MEIYSEFLSHALDDLEFIGAVNSSGFSSQLEIIY